MASRRWLPVGAGVALLAMLAWTALFLWGPGTLDKATWQELGPAERASSAAAFRSMLAQVGLGVGALGALIYTARSFYLARESQVVERYT
jgi:hypothetical protein